MKEGSGIGYVREGSGNWPLFIGAPLGNLGGGAHVLETHRDCKRALCKRSASVYGSCEGNMEEGLLYWEL
jgi:hypothetical protein